MLNGTVLCVVCLMLHENLPTSFWSFSYLDRVILLQYAIQLYVTTFFFCQPVLFLGDKTIVDMLF